MAPTWSPDGRKLLFGTISNGWRPAVLDLDTGKLTVFSTSAAKGLMKRAVFLYYLGSGRTVRVTPPDYCVNSAAWAAGGKIVFSAHPAVAGNSGTSNLYRMEESRERSS